MFKISIFWDPYRLHTEWHGVQWKEMLNDINLQRMMRIMVKFKLAISCGGWYAISKLKISKNKFFILCNEIVLKNLAALQKNSIFELVLTCPGIFSLKWPSIPMFYTCKKTFSSGLSAHQIWAWYLKACQKKVGCQNYCGLWDTL